MQNSGRSSTIFFIGRVVVAERAHPLAQLHRQLFSETSTAEHARFCEACTAALPAFVSEELAGKDVDRLFPETAAHLDLCPECLDEYRTLSAWMWSTFVDPGAM